MKKLIYYNTTFQAFFVDTYSPEVFFSLRKGSSSSVYAIRVRRDSDNAQLDIPFSGNFIDLVILLSFVGSANGFITAFYNQGTAGSTYDATQVNTANQLQIIVSGVLNTTVSGIISAVNNGLGCGYDLANPISFVTSEQSSFFIFERFATNNENVGLGNNSGSGFIHNGWISTGAYQSINAPALGTDSSSTGDYISTVIRDNSNLTSMFRNQVEVSGSPSTISATTSYTQILKRLTTGFRGNFMEYVHFFSDESTNQTAIEDEINSYYSIF